MTANVNIVNIVAGFIIGMLFTSQTNMHHIKGSGTPSFNDSCIDNLERLRQALLKSPYEITEEEGKELTKTNQKLFHKNNDIPKCLQLRDFSKWQQGQSSSHNSLYLLTLIEEHVKRQLSVSHHLYNWSFKQERKLDILSAILTRLSLLKKMLYTGTKLYQLYTSDKDNNEDELTLIDFLDDVELGNFDPNNIQTLTRVIPTDINLEPYPFVITDTRMSTSSIPSNISKQQRKTHQRVLKKLKKYMINFREIPDELLQCRDQPLTPRR